VEVVVGIVCIFTVGIVSSTCGQFVDTANLFRVAAYVYHHHTINDSFHDVILVHSVRSWQNNSTIRNGMMRQVTS
jgi:hypothetical protein